MEPGRHFQLDAAPLDHVQAVVERCSFFVGNDTGLRHMAVAAGIPTVTVFGQPRAANWTPPDDARHESLEHDPGCKSDCKFPECHRECLSGVSVDAVWEAVRSMVSLARR